MARVPSRHPDLDAAVREHRIWYEIHRETDVVHERRVTVALQVWLWATVSKQEGELPDSPGCLDAVDALHTLGQAAILRTEGAPIPDLEPFHWALYASKQVPGADELRVEVSLREPPDASAAELAAREKRLFQLRKALEAMGVFEGGWHAREAWTVRPAAAAAEWKVSPAGGALSGGVKAA
jgi:hypothetical protein